MPEMYSQLCLGLEYKVVRQKGKKEVNNEYCYE